MARWIAIAMEIILACHTSRACTACKRIRSDEPFLSHVARDPDLRVCMCMKVSTTVSVRLCVVVGDSVRLRDAVCQHCRQSDPVEDQ